MNLHEDKNKPDEAMKNAKQTIGESMIGTREIRRENSLFRFISYTDKNN